MRALPKIILLAFLLVATQAFALDVPYLTGRVNDNAQIMSAETRQALTEKLREHEERTTNQIVILTVATLEGQSIEDFADQVFREWKLGQADKDNGILMIIVPNDRQMRIEVGYGLEGPVTDLLAGRIIRNIMAPHFKEGDYDTGVTAGADALIMALEGEALPFDILETEPEEESGFFDGLEDPSLSIWERLLFGAFIFGMIGMFTLIGIMTPGFGWFLYPFLIPFWATFPVIVVGTKGTLVLLIAYLVLYPSIKLGLRRTEWYKKARLDLKTKGSTSIGGMTFRSGSSSGGGWSSGGGSSGGGGFSGGGGSSGGGGASGSW